MLGVLNLCLVAGVPYRIRSLLGVVSSILAVVSGFLNFFECVFLSRFWIGCIVLFGLSSLFLFYGSIYLYYFFMFSGRSWSIGVGTVKLGCGSFAVFGVGLEGSLRNFLV